jgi:hypothetical protein
MFTALAVCVVAVLWHAARCNTKDPQQRPGLFDDDEVRQSVVHARQDLKLIAFLLGAIVLMLGVVADRCTDFSSLERAMLAANTHQKRRESRQ